LRWSAIRKAFGSSERNLVLHLPFNEGSGTIIHGVGVNGAIIGASWISGKQVGFGKALSFDGTNDYVLLSIPTPFLHMNHITVEIWVYINSSPPAFHQRFFQNTDSSNSGGWVLMLEGAEDLYKFFVSVGSSWYSASATGVYDTWKHLVGTYDGHKVKIYVDGVESLGNAIEGVIDKVTTPQNYLMRAYNDVYVAGRLDLIRVYDRALSLGEIVSLYNYGR